MKAGKYDVIITGHGNEQRHMNVVVSKDRIENITFDEQKNDLTNEVFKLLPKRIIDNQSVNVDVISGATESSHGIIQGVKHVIQEADGDLTAFSKTTSSKDENVEFQPGTYESKVMSVGGPMKVNVTVSKDKITDIDIVENKDTFAVRDIALKEIPSRIIDNQSINVDAITGATLTSTFIKNAVRDAIKKATKNNSIPDILEKKTVYKAPKQQNQKTDLVIVGAGIAGISAFVTATKLGLKITLIERNAMLGGDSLVTGQFAFKPSTEPMNSNWKKMVKSFQEIGINVLNNEFPTVYGSKKTSLSFLEFPDAKEHQAMKYFIDKVQKYGTDHNGKILTDTHVEKLINANGEIKGVIAKPKGQPSFKIEAKAVILSTGGFANNSELVAKYLPYAKGAQYVGLPGAKGDALNWHNEINAKLSDIKARYSSFYAVNPHTGYVSQYADAHYVDLNGDLITEETYYNTGAQKVYEKIGNHPFINFAGENEIKHSKMHTDIKLYKRLLEVGSVKKFKNLKEVQKYFNLKNLIKTAEKLNLDINDTYYAGKVIAGIYGTYGGYAFDNNCQALNKDNQPIPNLFVAGEVTGNRDYQEINFYGGGLGNGLAMGYISANYIANKLR